MSGYLKQIENIGGLEGVDTIKLEHLIAMHLYHIKVRKYKNIMYFLIIKALE